ncbi:MAG: ATP-binding protein [Methanothrix sp.]
MAASMEELIERQKAEAYALIGTGFVERDVSISDNIGIKIIKVITGPRRSGKSVFALQSIKGMKFAYANMDDEGIKMLESDGMDYNLILRALVAVYGKFDIILLDEIQNLKNWQLFVNRLQREGYNLIITGSNSNLMSSELATHLTGRYIEKLVLPFSFKEFRRWKGEKGSIYKEENEGEILSILKDYLHTGGYPELVTKGLERTNYLRLLIDNTIYIDIVKRYGIRKPDDIRRLFNYLIDIYSKEFTYNSAADATEIHSVNTVKKYFGYLKEAYLILEVKRLEVKARRRQKSPRKIYAIDTGLADMFAMRFGDDYGRLMENAVAIELARREVEYRYWKDASGKEVDFAIIVGTSVSQLVQVCYYINERKVRNREISALINAAKELHCNNLIIITWDYEGIIEESGKKIMCIPLWKWLLQ